MAVRNVYYDSVYFMEVVVGGKRAASCREMFRRIRNGPLTPVISQAVVGETHAVVMRRYRDPQDLMRRVQILTRAFVESGADLDRSIVPIDLRKTWDIVHDLINLDKSLVGTDVIILAIALADPYSEYLLTWDSALLENKKIMLYEREMHRKNLRKSKLRIVDTL